MIRARNKREDRLLDVRIKFYEREKKIRLNMLRQQQHFFQRTRASLLEEMHRLQLKREHERLFTPAWFAQRPTSVAPSTASLIVSPSIFITEWETNPNEIHSDIVLPTIHRPGFSTSAKHRPQSLVY